MSEISYALPKGVKVLAGASDEVVCSVTVPFAPEVKVALDDLSKRLLSIPEAKEFPDIVSFAFWCRRANVTKKTNDWQVRNSTYTRIGRGLIFHVAPSNVPINFAYSFVFSFLAGNSNIVRVPSKEFAQVDIVCSAIHETLCDHPALLSSNTFVRYAADSDISSQLSMIASGRVVWGGDSTVAHIHTLPTRPRCIDIAFPDRYSIALLDSNSIVDLDEEDLNDLARAFYNDTYLMDQNACSSPQVLFWIGNNETGREIFWQTLAQFAKREYRLQTAVSIDKYVKLCEDTLRAIEVGSMQTYDPYLTHVDMTDFLSGVKNESERAFLLSDFRGTGGYFYEILTDKIEDALTYTTQKYQTLVYFGISPRDIAQALIDTKAQGIDRIVPIGQALDIDVIWDGYDLIGQLSRIIEVR